MEYDIISGPAYNLPSYIPPKIPDNYFAGTSGMCIDFFVDVRNESIYEMMSTLCILLPHYIFFHDIQCAKTIPRLRDGCVLTKEEQKKIDEGLWVEWRSSGEAILLR